jgi:hypothetical protein
VVVPVAFIFEVGEAGGPAVGAVDHVVRFAPGRGLVAAAHVLIMHWVGNHTCRPERGYAMSV